jgi:ribonuclease HII
MRAAGLAVRRRVQNLCLAMRFEAWSVYCRAMVLAGIDEAGYGPLLGPLVVGCCAFEVAERPEEAGNKDRLPCLWKRLRRIASKTRDKKGRRLHIHDSKVVYSPAIGLKELERSVLALAMAWGGPFETLESLIGRLAEHAVTELAGYRWYGWGNGNPFPVEQEAASVRVMSGALNVEMERCGVRVAHMGARLVGEKQFNRMVEQTRNKASSLFTLSAIHLDHLLKTFAGQNLTVFCDRQGGREHYGHLLRLMFEEWALEIVHESDGHGEYLLRNGGNAVRIIFREKAEAQCMAVAVASMLSKYVREALMRRFNAWWQQVLPGLEPTAGYYGDGARFLRDIEAKRIELGISDEELVRMR